MSMLHMSATCVRMTPSAAISSSVGHFLWCRIPICCGEVEHGAPTRTDTPGETGKEHTMLAMYTHQVHGWGEPAYELF